ncbi:hypothetical protein HU718_020525 [Pseudomonas tensinigenes]|uniref:DUF3800 domain-containing protein n=1 Tax=Pseudomonas tensinigenes TaxID=2745511 RepID=A0ABX8PSY2_9PSED|nr:hypothetical protein [Pseudomonas tensinigenes]QXI04415.1 hypothetical protein HU718_020525 [Pseudomonas tensinigenes]
MENHYLIIDESGAKGYSKNPEKYDGEFGAMAGFLMSSEHYEYCKDRFESTIPPKNDNGKRHITDFPFDMQQSIRDHIFDIFEKERIQWIYEAIFVQGLYESEFLESRGGSKNKKESLHAKLFMGLMIKVIASLNDFRDKEIELTIISDQIDTGVVRILKQEIIPYLSLIHGQPIESKFTIFDHKTKKVKKYVLKSSMTHQKNTQKYLSININLVCEDSAMTFFADILSNSAHYYIKKNYENYRIVKLNSKQAIAGHPLIPLLMHAYDARDESFLWPSDILYRRNKDQPGVEL